MLADVFSGSANVSPTPAPQMQQQNNNQNDGGLLDLMGGSPAAAMPPQAPVDVFGGGSAAAVADTRTLAFDKNGLTVFMALSKPDAGNNACTSIRFTFRNSTQAPMQNISFQAAVPKFLKLEMHPPTSTVIPANSDGDVSQEIRVINSMHGQKNIVLKVKVGYNHNGATVDEMATVSNFPSMY